MSSYVFRGFVVVLLFSFGAVFAAEPVRELRVLSYNIHICIGNDGKLDAERIAETILAQKPDLVALQEVDRKTNRVEQMDQPAELAKRTGMNVAFGKTIGIGGGDYGIAILSRFPIKNSKTTLLPNPDKQEERVALETTIRLDDETEIRFVCTHFCHMSEKRRILQAKKIDELFTKDDKFTILAGDINATPKSETLAVFKENWIDTTNREPTFPGSGVKIDYIFVRPTGVFRVRETKVIPEKTASDHFPVLTVLERGAPPA